MSNVHKRMISLSWKWNKRISRYKEKGLQAHRAQSKSLVFAPSRKNKEDPLIMLPRQHEFYLFSQEASRSSNSFNSFIVKPPEIMPCLRCSTCQHMQKFGSSHNVVNKITIKLPTTSICVSAPKCMKNIKSVNRISKLI